jgi:hypothetical protein
MSLIDVFKRHIHPLVQSVSKPEWFNTRCMICNDHNNKGLRGGFHFIEPEIVSYNCFNCAHVARYDPNDEKCSRITKNMRILLDAYNIPQDEVNEVLRENLNFKAVETVKKPLKYDPKVITLPDHFYELKTAPNDDKWKIISEHYLKDRLVNPNKYPFYLSTGDGFQAEKWEGRLIIPIYKDKQLIFYHGRSLVEPVKPKYLNVVGDREAVLYNYDEIFTYSDRPIFIVEGWFDAFLINGVAVIGKYVTDEQIYWLNRSNRKKIVIPDRWGDGIKMVNNAIKAEWDVSFPDFGACKDITDAMKKYGKLYVMSAIMKNVKNGFAAEMHSKLYFKD